MLHLEQKVPINVTLDKNQLPKSRLGSILINISTKYVQYQVKIPKITLYQKSNTAVCLQNMI